MNISQSLSSFNNLLLKRTKMIILGINYHHPDSSACLLKDGNIIAAVEEERFTKELNTLLDFQKTLLDFVSNLIILNFQK